MSTPQSAPGPQPDAKPLRADAARNRLKVLDAARAAFSEHGPNAQMDDIARRAGVGVGTVYRHFPTKQALAQAMMEQRVERIVTFIQTEMLPDPDPWRALARSLEFCGTMQEQDRGYAEAVASVAGGTSVGGGMKEAGPALIEQMFALTAVFIERAHAKGVVRADLTAADMSPIYAGLSAVVLAGIPDWRRYVEILLDGLRPQPDR
ncbi:TetR/AcrR family transcriptional regulator [Conexibacter woesei]|uniref:Transcriptional regulator, TetR family n=1 Tax=Conexibacter woesei (strain DSM 14684 / CCUG 47730 / CIP 108061 / JCM 11494 / NBRC 100937 / ID131577) TaxID=469383 RepID=D3FB03_CONWI|nr:TetR/AcrR family transcriptional regulator [Conexibacter woesei]ADB53195.1 transcriptional regulator, TetR family [Conexibacter woesei DSM 14684]